jgi:hypothetical protein
MFQPNDGGAIPISTAIEGLGPDDVAGKGRIAEGQAGSPIQLVLDVRVNTRRLSRESIYPRSARRMLSSFPRMFSCRADDVALEGGTCRFRSKSSMEINSPSIASGFLQNRRAT